jgi:two-component sensor histidine kinase
MPVQALQTGRTEPELAANEARDCRRHGFKQAIMIGTLALQSSPLPALLRMIEHLRPVRKNFWYGSTAGLLIFAAAFLLRDMPGWLTEQVPFITAYPAMLIATLVGGLRIGLMVVGMCLIAAWYVVLPPSASWTLSDDAGIVTLILFWMLAAAQLYFIDALDRAADAMTAERDRAGALFRDLQHCAANNMLLVAGLLQLQREAILGNPSNAAAAFDQVLTRLEVMSRIHQRLYDPEISQCQLTSYLKELVKDALQAVDASNIVCVLEVTQIDFEPARRMILSMIVHELVMNALKHAFPGRQSGIILLKLVCEEKTVVLSVQDDGTGFAGYPHGRASLGITIIHSLAAQLGGDVTWECTVGTAVRVAFPL